MGTSGRDNETLYGLFWQYHQNIRSLDWRWIATVICLTDLMGIPSDMQAMRPDDLPWVFALRGLIFTTCLLTGLVSVVQPLWFATMYNYVKMGVFLLIGFSFSFMVLGLQDYHPYWLGLVEAQIGVATFGILPNTMFIPGAVAVSFLYVVLESIQFGQPYTNTAVTLMLFSFIAIFGNYYRVRAESREYEQRSLAESESRKVNAVLQSLGDAFLMLDDHWIITYVNEHARKMLRALGDARSDLVGKHIWDTFPNLRHNSVIYPQLTECQRQQHAVSFEEYYPLLRAHLAVHAYPATNGIAVYCTDISGIRVVAEANRVQDIARRIVKARDRERDRIARELHDDLGQAFTLLRMDLAWLKQQADITDDDTRNRIAAMADVVGQSVASVRRLSTDLSPDIKDAGELKSMLNWLAGQLPNRTSIQCQLDMAELPETLDSERATNIFRVIQEAITNAVRHAKARQVWVTASHLENDDVLVTIEDDGFGFDPAAQKEVSSGIRNMQMRALELQGQLTIHSDKDRGTSVNLQFPAHA